MGHTVVGTLQALSLGATVVYKITVILYKKTIFFFFGILVLLFFCTRKPKKTQKILCTHRDHRDVQENQRSFPVLLPTQGSPVPWGLEEYGSF